MESFADRATLARYLILFRVHPYSGNLFSYLRTFPMCAEAFKFACVFGSAMLQSCFRCVRSNHCCTHDIPTSRHLAASTSSAQKDARVFLMSPNSADNRGSDRCPQNKENARDVTFSFGSTLPLTRNIFVPVRHSGMKVLPPQIEARQFYYTDQCHRLF